MTPEQRIIVVAEIVFLAVFGFITATEYDLGASFIVIVAFTFGVLGTNSYIKLGEIHG